MATCYLRRAFSVFSIFDFPHARLALDSATDVTVPNTAFGMFTFKEENDTVKIYGSITVRSASPHPRSHPDRFFATGPC